MSTRTNSAVTIGALTVTAIALVVIGVALTAGRTLGGFPSWAPDSVGDQTSVQVSGATQAVASSPDGATVYVGLFPAHGSGGIAIVDVATRTVRQVVPLPSGVLGLAVDRTGSRVYATESDTNGLAVINTGQGRLEHTIPVGAYPQGVGLSPDGRTAYVVDYSDNAVSVVDVGAARVRATAPVGTGPGELAVSPDGRQVVVGNQNDDSISVIDTAAPTAVGTVTVGEGASHVRFSPNGSRLWVSLSNHGFGPFQVLELDPSSHETRSTTDVDRLVFAMEADPTHVYAATVTPRGGPAFLDTIDADAGSVSRSDAVTGKPGSVALSPDGRLLWMTTGGPTLTVERVA